MPKSYQQKGVPTIYWASRNKHQTILKRFNLQPSEIWHALAECRNIVFQIKRYLATVPSVIFIFFCFFFSFCFILDLCCSEARMLLNLQRTFYVLFESCAFDFLHLWMNSKFRVDVFSLVNLTVTMTMSKCLGFSRPLVCTIRW